jgi:serine/threonine-protein kinase
LQAAHERGIVHRDVKPGNLLVRPDGKLVLTDFGIARSSITGNLTQVGSVLGTASYVSPEQASGTGSITPASDVYSLGVVAYQCLAGRRPFDGDSPIEVAMKHINAEPPPLPADVPDNVRAVVVRAMAKDVAARWSSAKAMAEAARAAAAGRPVPGGPVAGATALLSGGGTAVMPGGMTPTSPAGGAAPTSPARGGQFVRGAAAVPFAATQGDEEYQQTTGLQQTNQGAGGYQAAQVRGGSFSQGGGGYRQQSAGYSQGGGAANASVSGKMLGVAAAVLGVLLLGALLIFLLNPDDDKSGSGATGDTNTQTPSSAPQGIVIDPKDYVGRPVDQVKEELEAKHLNVVTKERRGPGAAPNEVTGVEPSDRPLQEWDTVTVYYQPKKAPKWTNPGGGGHTSGGGQPAPSATTADPTDTPTSPPTEPATPTPAPTSTLGGEFGTRTTDDSQKEFSG